jgi:hypothetical protein
MADKQYTVNSESLQTIGSKLDTVTGRLTSQTLTVSFAESRGALIDKLDELSKTLAEIGASLGTMSGQTAKLVHEIDRRFTETEDTLVDLFGG